ncbi:hypothetical protein LOK49_LG01G01917 [Camellia lanceoleosa]|uniref:Uncharacterized protein n=1 Tax=Camellia lanceoleosa TaxID=1840588 RepID=A0ACC0IVT7_9ERIC|nr:hypothetical protein LOK49_LG01G01917 [Camellia lanceoleosa]
MAKVKVKIVEDFMYSSWWYCTDFLSLSLSLSLPLLLHLHPPISLSLNSFSRGFGTTSPQHEAVCEEPALRSPIRLVLVWSSLSRELSSYLACKHTELMQRKISLLGSSINCMALHDDLA